MRPGGDYMTKKKWTVEIPDSALKDVPEEERERVKAEVEKVFTDLDHPEEIGRPVQQLPSGARFCPECGTMLVPGPTFPVPPKNEVVQIFDCPKCDVGYSGEPLN
jgi:hypothetical protein